MRFFKKFIHLFLGIGLFGEIFCELKSDGRLEKINRRNTLIDNL